jgi:gliding motility-associated-like protein
MKILRGFLLVWIGLIGLAGLTEASHIVGGNVMVSPGSQAGLYKVTVILYYDANSSDPNAEQNELTVSFFQKKDNARLNDLLLPRIKKEPLTYSNPGCAQARNIKTNVVQFSAEIRLSPDQYNDPEGYYVSWERCCRSGDILNIRSAGTSSLVLYTEFPALSVLNSSPVFQPANGEIVCRNTPYQFESGATDANGDKLRYRLETPFNSTRPPFGIDPLAPASAGPYPRSQWASGFSTDTPIPGSPGLTINENTGTISLTPTQTGLFIYRVAVEEYRNGKKIGEVHRDYQVLVIDCSDENSPPVSLTQALFPPNTSVTNGEAMTEIGICRGDTISLKAEVNNRWFYQWQRNGANIDKAIGPNILITQEGTYSVVKSFADRCSNARTLGENLNVKFRSPDDVKITPGPLAAICEGSTIDLTINVGGNSWDLKWKKDGKALPGVTGNIIPQIAAAGIYIVNATNLTTGCVTADTVNVKLNARPQALVTAPISEFCEGDSVRLQVSQAPNLAYTWYKEQAQLPGVLSASRSVRTGGLYSVEVRDTLTGCNQRSDYVPILVKAVPTVLFDSIPPLCGQINTRLSLSASPSGGTFTGTGINGTTFDARKAGTGSHLITYVYNAPNGCLKSRSQTINVVTAPRAQVGNDKAILAGESVVLRSSVTPGAEYKWSPLDGLTNAAIPEPVATPQQTTTYRLRVSTANGCYSEGDITVTVFPIIETPNGFTPNGDGVNDTWELKDINAYPTCEVIIFNRYGREIFRSRGYTQPWNGRWNGEALPSATYNYIIKLHPEIKDRSGSVTIFR